MDLNYTVILYLIHDPSNLPNSFLGRRMRGLLASIQPLLEGSCNVALVSSSKAAFRKPPMVSTNEFAAISWSGLGAGNKLIPK